jgi:2-keto-4-pentenoate hydratase
MSRSFDDPRIAAGMREQAVLRRRGLDRGARQIGWKVGMGAPALKQKLGLTAPIVGFLLDRARLPSGATVSLRGWQKPVAEAEIAAYIGRDLPSGAPTAAGRAALNPQGPAH